MKIRGSTALILDLSVVNPSAYTGIFSCFVTMMLSTTRAIALAKPLYIIKEHLVRKAFLTFTSLLFLLLVTKSYLVYHQYQNITQNQYHKVASQALAAAELFIVVAIVITVIISSVVSVRVLKKAKSALNGQKNNRGNNRSAAIMIVILSITFIIFNATWSLMWMGLWIYISYKPRNFALLVIITFQNLVLVTLNSCANPLVYLVKNSGLHDYTKKNLLRLTKFVVGKFEVLLCNT